MLHTQAVIVASEPELAREVINWNTSRRPFRPGPLALVLSEDGSGTSDDIDACVNKLGLTAVHDLAPEPEPAAACQCVPFPSSCKCLYRQRVLLVVLVPSVCVCQV